MDPKISTLASSITLTNESTFSIPDCTFNDLSLYFSTQASESAFPLKDLSSSRDFGGFGSEEPIPPKLISISGFPEMALLVAVTASLILSDSEFFVDNFNQASLISSAMESTDSESKHL